MTQSTGATGLRKCACYLLKSDFDAQRMKVKLANDYDKLADRAEDRIKRDGTPGPSPIPKVR
jgi:hypothetical protein